MRPKTIAIDGPAGSGKSTIGYALADRLGYAMLDTGLLYRLAAVAVIDLDMDVADPEKVVAAARDALALVSIEPDDNGTVVAVKGQAISELSLHDARISKTVPKISRIPEVRKLVQSIQQQMLKQGKTVLAGRDIGTVVAPNAELKLYLDVSLNERAARRMWSQGVQSRSTESAIRADLAERDELDSSRPTSPLRIADDALVVRTDKMAVEETVNIIILMCGLVEASHG